MAAKKPVNVALQGGGAHGAYAWGILDYLVEDGRLDIKAITATSAGAMNAAVFAYGYHLDGPEGARAKMREFWREVSRTRETFFPFDLPDGNNPFLQEIERFMTHVAMETMNIAVSPYHLNPLGYNPLEDILCKVINFSELNRCNQIKLFVTATNVQTGKARVFKTEEICVKALIASASLPQLYQAVERDGEYYWDGGYMGNPSLWPLFYETDVEDLVAVHINPIVRRGIPKTPAEINNRVNEISFNAALLKEMRAIAFVQKLLANGWLTDKHKGELSNIRFHSIRADEVFAGLGLTSKYDTSWRFLEALFHRGREEGARWLDTAFDAIGNRNSTDLHEEFLDL